MRIVDVNEFYAERGGGVRTYVGAKLRAAAEHGHFLSVIAPGPRDHREARFGGEVIWLKSPPLPVDPRYYILYRQRAVHEWLERLEPDVVEGSSAWTSGWFAGRSRGRAKKALIYHQDPIAVYPHTLFDRYVRADTIDRACTPYWAYTRALARRFDVTVVAGAWLAQRLASHGIDNAVAVPFGIDRSLFSPAHRDDHLRAELLQKCGLPPTATLLVTVSRHHPEKRLPTIIDAVRRVQEKRACGLVVIGDGPLRPYIDRCARAVPHVYLEGFVADRSWVAKALASADAMVHGSAAETYGFVIAEALSSGTPVVVPNRGGAFELVTPDCAEVYEPGDAAACAGAVERLLERERETVSLACEAHAKLTVGTQADHFTRLFALYERLVQA